MNSYEEFNNQITAGGKKIALNKAREACCQKNADSVKFVSEMILHIV
jgi:hypothetical protein